MGLFSRASRDLIGSADLASFGRFEMLGPEISGVPDSGAALALLEPLRAQLYSGPQAEGRIGEEIRRHAQRGEWEAVGAWKFASNFVADPGIEAEMTDAGLRAIAMMQVTNLAIHLGSDDLRRFEELTGKPAPNDGFFGPPVFASDFGPGRRYYLEQAIAAAADRAPQRIASCPGVSSGPLGDAARSLWDFGQLVLRGPLLVSQDVRFEPATVREAVVAATDVDHRLFAEALLVHLDTEAQRGFNGWAYMGSGRFVEDYLDSGLTATPVHAGLVDRGIRQLIASGSIGREVSVDVLSAFERERLALA